MDRFDRAKRKMARYTRLYFVTACSIPPIFFVSMTLGLGGEYFPIIVAILFILVVVPCKIIKTGNELHASVEEKYKNGAMEDDYKRLKKNRSNLFKKSAILIFGSLGTFLLIVFFHSNGRFEFLSLVVIMATFIACSIGIHDSYKGDVVEIEKSHVERIKKQEIDGTREDAPRPAG